MSWFAILSLLFSFQICQVLQVLLWNSLWLYLSSRLLLLASQRRRFLFVDISDVHHCYVVPIVTFRTSADVCSYGQTFCFVYVHGFH